MVKDRARNDFRRTDVGQQVWPIHRQVIAALCLLWSASTNIAGRDQNRWERMLRRILCPHSLEFEQPGTEAIRILLSGSCDRA